MSEECRPHRVALDTNGDICRVMTPDETKGIAYFNFQKVCSTKREMTEITVSKTAIKSNLTNVYSIRLEVYPVGCPVASLPINVEIVNPNDFIRFKTEQSDRQISIKGLIPVGSGVRFFTNLDNLRYFSQLQLKGEIVIGTAACQLDKVNEHDSNTDIIYVSNRPSGLSILPPIPAPPPGANPLFPAQYPNPDNVYPWSWSIIPWEKDQANPEGEGVIIQPPAPVPPVSPFIDGHKYAYDKFRSTPDSVIFYVGYDPEKVSPIQEDWTVFLRNFEDRGYAKSEPNEPLWQSANLQKKQYMSAFTIDKMQYYKQKIFNFVNKSFTEVVANRKPLTSSFQQNLNLFFLELHIGEDDYPDYVIEFFSGFIEFVGRGDQNNQTRTNYLMRGHYLSDDVVEYFRVKSAEVIARKDKTCIVYWFNKAGMPNEAILTESTHNIVAFTQFINTLYSIVYTSLVPTNPINPALPPYPNFLNLFSQAQTGEERLNIVREVFRLTVPNSNSFSAVNGDSQLQARHLHQEIMIQNNPGNDQTQKLFSYFTYNPALYADFNTTVEDYEGLPNPDTIFDVVEASVLDHETIIDKQRPILPIFSRPIYASFGLGYRRCAGEVLSYLITHKLLDTFSKAEYEIRPGNYPTVYVAPFKGVSDNIFAKQPFN